MNFGETEIKLDFALAHCTIKTTIMLIFKFLINR